MLHSSFKTITSSRLKCFQRYSTADQPILSSFSALLCSVHQDQDILLQHRWSAKLAGADASVSEAAVATSLNTRTEPEVGPSLRTSDGAEAQSSNDYDVPGVSAADEGLQRYFESSRACVQR